MNLVKLVLGELLTWIPLKLREIWLLFFFGGGEFNEP